MSDNEWTWERVGKLVGKAAPALGMAIAGPGGAAIGGIVAAALGTANDAEEVAAALETNPDAYIKLKEIELANIERLEQMAFDAASAAIGQVNETMRAETKSDKWWVSGWRPFWGYVSAVGFFIQVGAVAYLIVTGGDHNLISELGSLSVFWSVPLAVLGIASWHRGQEKRVAAGEVKVPLISRP
jgi:hypothetical protein